MDQRTLLMKVAAVLSTLLETNGSPESHLYMFCDMNMDAWQRLRYVLVESGMVTIKGNYVTLTQDGRIKAEAINKVIAQKAS